MRLIAWCVRGLLLLLWGWPVRCWHRWDVFQVAGRWRCRHCGAVSDFGTRYRSVDDFFAGRLADGSLRGEGGRGWTPGRPPKLPQGGSGTARPVEFNEAFGRAVAAVHRKPGG